MTASVTDSLPTMLTIQQAADWLGADPKTVRRCYIAQGRMTPMRQGPRLMLGRGAMNNAQRSKRPGCTALPKSANCSNATAKTG